jgi:integrase
MARAKANVKLNSRDARIKAKLQVRSEPYWQVLSKGLAVGYFKGSTGGTWVARHFTTETGRRKSALGVADDFIDADGIKVLTFDQAQAKARTWHEQLMQSDSGEVLPGKYSVEHAMNDYLADRERIRRKRLTRTRSVVKTHITPTLGAIELAKLTHGKLKAWRDGLAETNPRVRSKLGSTGQAFRDIDLSNEDVARKRQATANRIFTVLRAALNHAYKETKKVSSNAAWNTIRPFREVDAPKVRYLTVNECKALIMVCPADFRALVRAALYTGCRYGELMAMQVDAFSTDSNSIHIPRSKSGKGRYVPVTNEGAAFFHPLTKDRQPKETMFVHADGPCAGAEWEDSQQRYWMELACTKAEIAPMIGFHILRHTYASQLAMNGTPMPVIASLLGHADTRMTEKHYGHLAPSYVADTLRANLPSFGFEMSQPGPVLVARAS